MHLESIQKEGEDQLESNLKAWKKLTINLLLILFKSANLNHYIAKVIQYFGWNKNNYLGIFFLRRFFPTR